MLGDWSIRMSPLALVALLAAATCTAAAHVNYATSKYTCRGIDYSASDTRFNDPGHEWTQLGAAGDNKLIPGTCQRGRSAANQQTDKDIYMVSPSIFDKSKGVDYQILIPCWGTDAMGYICCGELAFDIVSGPGEKTFYDCK